MHSSKRYIFGAHASGVAAHIRRPINRILPVQAASALPVTGGHAESKVGPSGLPHFLHFNSAETFAHGDFVDQAPAEALTKGEDRFDSLVPRTTVTASVRGLHVGKRFSVGVADAGLITQRQKGDSEPTVKLVETRLEEVSVDGFHLKITLKKDPFVNCNTFAKAAAAFSERVGEHTVYCNIIEKIEWADKPDPKAKIDRNTVQIPDFGTVYFGELLVGYTSRRLTLVRIQLGCDDGGDVSCCECAVEDPDTSSGD